MKHNILILCMHCKQRNQPKTATKRNSFFHKTRQQNIIHNDQAFFPESLYFCLWVLLLMCNRGASFLCVHNIPIVSLHLSATPQNVNPFFAHHTRAPTVIFADCTQNKGRISDRKGFQWAWGGGVWTNRGETIFPHSLKGRIRPQELRYITQ